MFTLLPADKTGVNFANTIRETSTQNVLNYEYFYNGGGVAVGDINNDHLPDIVFTANTEDPKIYLNKGGFVFEDISKKSRIHCNGWKTGVTMADVNADGWLDIYICRSGNGDEYYRKNLLYINQKNGTFKEMAERYGLDDKGYSTQAAFFDYDHDGDIDMYLVNHPIKRLSRFDVAFVKAARDSLAGDKLFRNDGGRFTDVSFSTGISGNPISFGLGIAVADFNDDGWSDIYVTNDYDEDDYLYINQKDGKFKESGSAYFGHTSKFSMGCDVADVNNDGITDLLTLDMLPEDNKRQKLLKGPDSFDFFQMLLRNGYSCQYMRNMLQLGVKNNNSIVFSEIGQFSGISNTDWSWSALFGDYDLDGFQDLFITNGYMRDYTNMDFLKYTAPEAIRKARSAGAEPDMLDIVKKMPSSALKNYLFKNKGRMEFENANQGWGMDTASLSNGAAYGDFDNDGDWDLVVNNINQPAFIWQNHAEELGNNFIKIKFRGPSGNPFGIGTKVTVTDEHGFKQIQELELAHGFQSSAEPCLIFGIGKRKTVNIKIVWNNDKVQFLENVKVNQVIEADNNNALSEQKKGVEPATFFTEVNLPGFSFRHIEDDYNDFKREPLLPHQYSREGPAMAVADINGDGRKDVFIGGAKNQPAAIFLNMGDGSFKATRQPELEAHLYYEDVNAIFGDFDNDKDQDLYIVSGGNEDNFEDRIYWNDGKGKFFFLPDVLPATVSSGSAVAVFDFDGDGDLDIFRGGKVSTGSYPLAPQSYLLQNTNGSFKDVTPVCLKQAGMISSAAVADMNKDGLPDLLLAGEFMPVTIFKGMSEAPWFSEKNTQRIAGSSGWWNCIQVHDIDNDGDLDIVAGNYGLNSQIKPKPGQPVSVDAGDLDNNGSLDAILSYFIQGKSYPVATRDELLDQAPSMKIKFPSYFAYAEATVKDIFTEDQLKNAVSLSAEEFRSGVFINQQNRFVFTPFVNEAQLFPVKDILIADFNKDGKKDLLLAGNNYAVRAQWGRYDAGKGLLLLQDKPGSFSSIPDSGFLPAKDVRKMELIDGFVTIGNNNDSIQVFRINPILLK